MDDRTLATARRIVTVLRELRRRGDHEAAAQLRRLWLDGETDLVERLLEDLERAHASPGEARA